MIESRWFAPGRPVGGVEPFPYSINEPTRGKLDAYRQNELKGDFPILGEDLFLNVTFTDRFFYQFTFGKGISRYLNDLQAEGGLDGIIDPGSGYAMCDAHASALTAPVGWVIEDRRSPMMSLFAVVVA